MWKGWCDYDKADMYGLRADSIRLGILDYHGCAVGGERMMDYLLVEHKDRCWDCDLMRIDEMHEIPFCGRTGGRVEMDSKPDWCPLRPIPKRLQLLNPELLDAAYEVKGWNECLDAITGGDDESDKDNHNL